MKKIFYIIILFLAVLLTGCTRSDNKKSEIETAVQNFYKSNYEYEKITTKYVNGEKKNVILEGKITHSPYREYIKATSSDVERSWSEGYFYGDGEVIQALIKIDNEWQNTTMKIERPYGYGEDLIFDISENSSDSSQIYYAKYTIDIGKRYRLDETIEATINQKYYFDNNKKQLTCIETDLTEYNEKVFIANDISANGVSLETAQKDLENAGNLSETEQLNILNYNDSMVIELPSK